MLGAEAHIGVAAKPKAQSVDQGALARTCKPHTLVIADCRAHSAPAHQLKIAQRSGETPYWSVEPGNGSPFGPITRLSWEPGMTVISP